VSVRQLAQDQRLSVKYLERIMSDLRAAGLARAVRGARGGYTLALPPGRIRVGDILRALEGRLAIVECVEHPEECPLRERCPTRSIWVEMERALSRIVEGTTLRDLVRRSARKAGRRRTDVRRRPARRTRGGAPRA
jgi:Rrf2 family protein